MLPLQCNEQTGTKYSRSADPLVANLRDSGAALGPWVCRPHDGGIGSTTVERCSSARVGRGNESLLI